MAAKRDKELLAFCDYETGLKLGVKMNKTEFRVEFSPVKFKRLAILSLMFSPIIVLIGIALALGPFFLPNDETLVLQNKLLDMLLLCGVSLLIIIIGYAMGIVPWRFFKHCKENKPLAIFNETGISGFNPWGLSHFLPWQNIDKVNIVQSHGGNMVFFKSQKETSITGFIFSAFAHLHPASISIPIPYTKTKTEAIQDAFIELNPLLEEKFLFKD